MSIKIMTNVWAYSTMKGSALLLLLSIADNADETGLAWPGIEYLARKTRMSTRQTIRILQTIADAGEISIVQDRKYNRYVINVWPPYDPEKGYGTDRCAICGATEHKVDNGKLVTEKLHSHHIVPIEYGGAKDGKTIRLCQTCHKIVHEKMRKWGLKTSSDILSPKVLSGDIPPTIGDILSESSDIAMSLKPSITITKEPPLEQERKLTPLQEMVEAIAHVTGSDLKLNYGRMAREAQALMKSGYTPEIVRTIYAARGPWFMTDWRGKKGELPGIHHIRETIGQLSRFATKEQQYADEDPGELDVVDELPEETPEVWRKIRGLLADRMSPSYFQDHIQPCTAVYDAGSKSLDIYTKWSDNAIWIKDRMDRIITDMARSILNDPDVTMSVIVHGG